jgi:protein involved in polysaccharide export with SLBB domain
MTLLRSATFLRPRLRIAALGMLVLAQAALGQDSGNSSQPGSQYGTTRPADTGTPPRSSMDTTSITNAPRSQGAQGNPASADSNARNADGTTRNVDGSRRSGDGDRNEPVLRRAEPPPKPSEFQKFVEAATGRLLPVFGSSFFTAPADSFAPLDNVPVSSDYTVGPGDEIVVRAWGAIDIDYRSTVDRNGQLNLPRIGSFTVAGVKASDLEKQLRSQIGRLFTNFNLSVTLGRLHGVKVFVVGPARLPGVFTLSSQSTLLSAVVAAGGPGPNGSMRKVSLRRDGVVVSELDVYEFLVQGDKSKDLQLVAGDVVVFHPVGPRVALNGDLDNAAIYELKGAQEPVSSLLHYAGGAPVLANPNRALIERIDPSQPRAVRFVEEIKLDVVGLGKPLRDGDVVTLLAISPAFANAVTLRGHVAQPLRYAYFPGMRISDLIPSAEALVSPDFYRRKNVLVQVLPDDKSSSDETSDRRADRVSESGESANLRRAASTAQRPRQTAENIDALTTVERAKRSPTALFDDLNWDYAVVERLNTKDLSTEVIPFNLGKVVLQGDAANNILLIPGDVVTVFSQKDFKVPVARQNRLVSLEGEVVTPGVYQLLPGETLRQLIARAGGFTPQAYVFGIEFSREETRQRQRENLAAAIARLESLAANQAAREAANRRDEVSAANGAAASTAASTAQLTRLSRIQPNGRIALELSPDVNSVDALPDLPLENADRVLVPPRPGFVTVVGAVVNNNAFLWRPGRTAGDYLRIAGPDEAANLSNLFILRADGTISSGSERSGFFGSASVESQAMNPGDALIVPNQLDFETWGRAFTRNVKDWTQILANFGLGIAAFKTLGL